MNQSPLLPLREELAAVTPYGAPQLEVEARLNVNENPYSPSPEMVADIAKAVARVGTGLNRYPDRDFVELRQALADYLLLECGHSFPVQQIWAANGSNEVMAQLLGAYAGPGRIVLGTEHSYSMYPEYVRGAHSRYVTVPRQSDFNVDLTVLTGALQDLHPSVLLLANPNNPTGTVITEADLKQILQVAQQTGPIIDGESTATVVVIDEAYGEFRDSGQPSALALLEKFPHLAVSRTMSKSFGMAGLRLGYLVAAKTIIYDIMRVRLPITCLHLPRRRLSRLCLTRANNLTSLPSCVSAEINWLAGLQLRGMLCRKLKPILCSLVHLKIDIKCLMTY